MTSRPVDQEGHCFLVIAGFVYRNVRNAIYNNRSIKSKQFSVEGMQKLYVNEKYQYYCNNRSIKSEQFSVEGMQKLYVNSKAKGCAMQVPVLLNYLYNSWLCISCAAETLPFFSLTATEFTDLFSNPVMKVPPPSADELNNILLDATNCFDSDNDIDDNIVQHNQMDTYFSV